MSKKATPAHIIAQEYVEAYPLDELIPHPRNARQGDLGMIGESIAANGFFGAVLIQKSTRFCLAGNHRALAAAQRGLDAVPAFVLDIDDAQALKILLVDNKANDDASYNSAGLADLLQDVLSSTGTLAGTGYDGDDLDALLADLKGSAPGDAGDGGGDGDEAPPCGKCLLFGPERIPLSDGEADEFTAALESWRARVGSLFGFAGSLLAHG